MKDIYKLALLITVLVISMMPIAYFLFYDLFNVHSHANYYISQLFSGDAHITIDVPMNSFRVVSNIALGLWATSLSYMLVVFISAIAFLISLGLIARLLYQINMKKQVTSNVH